MSQETVTTLFVALLSAGGAAFIGAAARSWTEIRQGARTRARDTLSDLERWREEAEDGRRQAVAELRATAADRDYWRNVASRLHSQLTRAGFDPVVADPVAPSERAAPHGAIERKGGGTS